MKRIFIAMLAMGTATVINAQTQTGDWMIGGTFHLNTANSNTQIAFTPNAGVFIIENLAVGGNLSFNYSKSGTNKYTSFGIGPFARYYFTTTAEKVRPFIQGSLNYLSTKQTIANNTSSTNTGLNYFVGGGAALFISPNVSVDALVGYDHTKYRDFAGSGGLAFNIGFQVYINKNQVDKLRGK